jgi:hypothetical protein
MDASVCEFCQEGTYTAPQRYGEILLDERKFADAKREFTEASAILKKQDSPPPLWVTRATKGLDSATLGVGQVSVAKSTK